MLEQFKSAILQMGQAYLYNIAKQTRSMIEVLYVTPAGESKIIFNSLLDKLADLSCDFQITYLSGNPYGKITEYSIQREDNLSVVCSSIEPFKKELKTTPQPLKPTLRFTFPTIILVGNNILT